MGFQLVIAEGKEAGRQFDFDQSSVLIGRTAECDVILYEVGVSRKHALISVEPSGVWIEDLGSSNGTRVNGQTIKEKLVLKDGDSISMGPVVFNFKPADLEPVPPELALGDSSEGKSSATRIISTAELQRSRNKGVAGLGKDMSRDDMAAMNRRSTSVLPALLEPRPSVGKGALAKPPPRRPVRTPAPLPPPDDGDSDAAIRPMDADTATDRKRANRLPERAPLAAADKARLERAGLGGRLQVWWSQRSLGARVGVVLGLLLAFGGPLGFLGYSLAPVDTKPKAKEPTVLSSEPITHSFGLGQNVTFERADQKSFDFEVKSPVQVMVVLQYQAKDVGAKDEVQISVNGVDIGFVPPDTLDTSDRTLELIIPAQYVKREEVNTVTFDNLLNPPGTDPWRIWNIFIDVVVLPEKETAALVRDAQDKFVRGTREWEEKEIGASNRWDAYKNFREAWLTLEALPMAERPGTYQLARTKMLEAKRELDTKCKELLLRARSAYNFNKLKEARLELDHVNDFFPSRSHPCQYRAEVERQEMEL